MAGLADAVRAARPASRACGAALLAGLLLSYVLSVLTPTLLVHHALLLEALSGNVASIVIGGAQVRADRASAVLVLLAPLLGIVLYDVAFWWAGRLWGNQVLGRFVRTPKGRRRLERTEELVARRGVVVLSVAYFLPLPNPATYVLCGASGMRLAVFVVGDALGTVLWTSVLASLGYAVGRPVLDLLDTLEHWTLLVTVVLVGVAVVLSRWRNRTRRHP